MVSENDEGYIRGFREAMRAVAGTMGWPPEMGPFEVLEAVKELKAQVDKREEYHRRRAAELEEASDLLGPIARQVEGYIDYCLSMAVDPENHDSAVQAVQVAVVPEVMQLERERDRLKAEADKREPCQHRPGGAPRRWYAMPNDTIGGWCVRDRPTPPSKEAQGTIADFTTQEDAEYIVRLHHRQTGGTE